MSDPDPLTALDPEIAALVQPLDGYNRSLVDRVHPVAWDPPEPAGRYHLVVVGGGTAGLVSAAGAAGLGARVALVERRLLGGDCLNYGCVPSKAVIRAARAWHGARQYARFGAPRSSGDGDFGIAMERMRRLRAEIARHDSAERFRELGVDVFIGAGRFVAADALEVGGRRLAFRRAVIATGARPVAPPIPGADEIGYRTSESIFTLTERPRRLGVLGGGPIGCELAQTFARFGSEVTLFDMADQVLPREDPDAAQVIRGALERDGVRFRLGVHVVGFEHTTGGKRIAFECDGEPGAIEVDELLVAIGRKPNVEGLDLDAAGVARGATGLHVDDRLRTSNRRIYAVGDVASRFQFTHMADALARIAIQNALFFGRARASDLVVPWCTYTDPEIAHVGMYERDAEERGLAVDTLTVPLSEVDRAVLEGSGEGFLRLHVERGKDRILGATLVAEHAGDMLGELCLAVTHRVGLSKIASTIHPYPTQGEVVKKAADQWRRGKLTPLVRRLFDAWFRLLR